MPFRLAMAMLIEAGVLDEWAAQAGGGHKSAGSEEPKVEPVASKAGGVHADWYSRLLRSGGTLAGFFGK